MEDLVVEIDIDKKILFVSITQDEMNSLYYSDYWEWQTICGASLWGLCRVEYYPKTKNIWRSNELEMCFIYSDNYHAFKVTFAQFDKFMLEYCFNHTWIQKENQINWRKEGF